MYFFLDTCSTQGLDRKIYIHINFVVKGEFEKKDDVLGKV